jgi:hypothetical protein
MCLLLVARVSWPQAARSGSWPRSKDRSTRSSWGKSTRAGRGGGGERARPAGGGGGGGGAPGCPPPEYSRLSSEKWGVVFLRRKKNLIYFIFFSHSRGKKLADSSPKSLCLG